MYRSVARKSKRILNLTFIFLLSVHVLPSLREHRVQEGKVMFQLGVSVQGDVVVSVYHMRSTIGGRLQAKVESMYFSMPNPKESVLQPMYSIKSISQSASDLAKAQWQDWHNCVGTRIHQLVSSTFYCIVHPESKQPTKLQEERNSKKVLNFLTWLVHKNKRFYSNCEKH